MNFLRVAAVTLITCGAITDACTAKTTEQWAAVGCTVATVSGTDVAALGTIGAAANWNGCVTSKITCSNNGGSSTAFTVDSSGIAENVCTALSADEWAAKGCVVTTVGGTTVSGVGSISDKFAGYKCAAIACDTDGGSFTATKTAYPCATKGTYTGTFVNFDFSAAATAGTVTGVSFAGKNFASAAEDLIVVVDGGSTTYSVVADCTTVDACATALNTQITGASVAAVGGKLVITSTGTLGSSSKVAITTAGTGTNALALFGSTTPVDGVAATTEVLKVSVDGATAIEKTLTANCNTVDNCITAIGATIRAKLLTNALTGTNELSFASAHGLVAGTAVVYNDNSETTITGLTDGTEYFVLAGTTTSTMKLAATSGGTVITIAAGQGAVNNKITYTAATVTNVDNKIKITSSSTGTSSTIDIDASSGAKAKLLFTNSVTSDGQLDRVPNSDKSTANSITQSGGSLTCHNSFYATGTEASKVGAVTCNAAGEYSGVTCAPLTCRFLICSLIPNTAAVEHILSFHSFISYIIIN